ncbi:MAG TPA: Crp/Fnr family transcriptional regulator [Thermoanaerobaculia bacterium]
MPAKDAHAHAPSLREVFDRDASPDARVRVEAHQPVYATGDEDDSMYLIESGQVKVSMSSAAGKDCLLAIYTAGDVFGESCFNGNERRIENAIAMQASVVRRIPRRNFLAAIDRATATHSLARHLSSRLTEREMAVFDLVTMPSERRLAKVLLEMAERLGGGNGDYLVLDHRVSHEELSQIVGTTRPRITAFLAKFRKLGLLERDGRIIKVHIARTREYVQRD